MFDEYWSFGRQVECKQGSLCTVHTLHHWQTEAGKQQTELFRQIVAIDHDPNRKADALQNGARL